MDLHGPQKRLQLNTPLFDELLRESLRLLHGLCVRNDGDNGSRSLEVEALEEPSEVRVPAADGAYGIIRVFVRASSSDVDAKISVSVATFAVLLRVCDRQMQNG